MINQAVADAMREFDGRPIRDFVPTLVERAAGAVARGQAGLQPAFA